ncbi:hypothetical protein [Microbacterium sp. NC79]|uniref:hypothetical protein n=1 Tax=Microbacterium sp. NC79 TaxID=2851009 RepID=UPI001C2BAFE1|nr:hypothetical protein [Microbacterium sp. NC79]MBV0895842.1 hypothetical protein [Microbacterium sp. NC79]
MITASRHHGITASRHHGITASRHHGITASGKRAAKIGLVVLGTVALCGASFLPSTSVAASEENESPTRGYFAGVNETAPLSFGGFDVERAAENGFDVRTDPQGWQYAVPFGTPEDSMEGAEFRFHPVLGVTELLGEPNPSPRNTVGGECGTSTITLYTRTSGYTAYNLNGSMGGAIYHTWKVGVSSQTANAIVDKSGLPPFPTVSLSWGTDFTFDVGQSSTVYAAMGEGVVETVLGICYSTGPSDSI